MVVLLTGCSPHLCWLEYHIDIKFYNVPVSNIRMEFFVDETLSHSKVSNTTENGPLVSILNTNSRYLKCRTLEPTNICFL